MPFMRLTVRKDFLMRTMLYSRRETSPEKLRGPEHSARELLAGKVIRRVRCGSNSRLYDNFRRLNTIIFNIER